MVVVMNDKNVWSCGIHLYPKKNKLKRRTFYDVVNRSYWMNIHNLPMVPHCVVKEVDHFEYTLVENVD